MFILPISPTEQVIKYKSADRNATSLFGGRRKPLMQM